MNDKKIKEAMKQYIETQADNISSESEEKHDLTSLDEKVYATLGTNQNKHKTAAVWSFRKISALAATLDRKSTRLNSSHTDSSRMPSSA